MYLLAETGLNNVRLRLDCTVGTVSEPCMPTKKAELCVPRLVAGEGQDLKRLPGVLLLKLCHFLVVKRRQASFGGDVHNQHRLQTTMHAINEGMRVSNVACIEMLASCSEDYK